MTRRKAIANLRNMIRDARTAGDTNHVAHLENRIAQWQATS